MYEPLEANRIRMHLSPVVQEICHGIDVLDTVDSTNAWLMAYARSGQQGGGRVCLAETQTAGRGRRGKQWSSPAVGNFYLSLGWQIVTHGRDPAGVTLALGLGALEALSGLGVGGVGLKWPNDLYLDGAKLGGILVESVQTGEDQVWIIGLGLNLIAGPAPTDGGVPPAGLVERWPEAGGYRNRIAATLIDSLFRVCLEFEQFGPEDMLARWMRYDITRNKAVDVIMADGRRMRGVAGGIDMRGRLRVLCDDREHYLDAGEVSLRLM